MVIDVTLDLKNYYHYHYHDNDFIDQSNLEYGKCLHLEIHVAGHVETLLVYRCGLSDS